MDVPPTGLLMRRRPQAGMRGGKVMVDGAGEIEAWIMRPLGY